MPGEVPKFSESGMPAEPLAVLDKKSFLTDFALEARRASENARIHATALFIDTGEVGQTVLDIFKNAPPTAKKSMRLDASSQLTPGGQFAFPTISRRVRRNLNELQSDYIALMTHFEEAGVSVDHMNTPEGKIGQMIPLRGRMHIKGSYVDNREADGRESVFYLHTNNFGNDKTVEVVTKFTGDVAEKLIETFDGIFREPPLQDQTYAITDDMLLFVDAGNQGESLILNTGVQLIDNTRKARVWSWMKPDGAFAAALRKAKNERGAAIEVLSSKFKPKRPYVRSGETLLWAANKRMRKPPYSLDVDSENTIHAKGFIVELENDLEIRGMKLQAGTEVAFFGTHNNSTKGVKAGTQEMQLLTTNPVIIQQLKERYIRDSLVAKAN